MEQAVCEDSLLFFLPKKHKNHLFYIRNAREGLQNFAIEILMNAKYEWNF